MGAILPKERAPRSRNNAGLVASNRHRVARRPCARAGARAIFVLNLDAEPAAVTPERLAQIEAMLRDLAGEPGLTIERIEKGSLPLVVSDPSGALGRLQLPALREALETKFSLHLFGIAPEHALEELGELTAELLRASDDLLSWPDTLPSGEQIERPEPRSTSRALG